MKAYLVILMACIFLISCGKQQSKEEKAPTNIRQLHPQITSTYFSQDDDAIEIIVTYNNIWNSGAVLFGLSSDIQNIMRLMIKHKLTPKNQRIRFTAEIPLIDKYGNEKLTRVISVTYLTDDLVKINYENKNFLPQMMLDLYESIWRVNPIADQLVYDYCRLDIAKYGKTFCMQEN